MGVVPQPGFLSLTQPLMPVEDIHEEDPAADSATESDSDTESDSATKPDSDSNSAMLQNIRQNQIPPLDSDAKAKKRVAGSESESPQLHKKQRT